MVNLQWDYTDLARAYLKRPDYAPKAVDVIVQSLTGHDEIGEGIKVCDVGAGVAHLTLHFAARGFGVDAVEPNDNMRALGQERTKNYDRVHWYNATGEDTQRAPGQYDIVSFGSSFNVVDRLKALKESSRIGKKKAVFAALWNHRQIDDPLQHEIESIISSGIPGYDYGSRRVDQTDFLQDSGLVTHINFYRFSIEHAMKKQDCLEAWRSHATLQRQAGEKFSEIIDRIAHLLNSIAGDEVTVPYHTVLWTARLND